MIAVRRFFDTLGFLSRLAPARIIPEEEMNRCMAYMTAVGLALGLVIVAPFDLGLFSGAPWVQAWLMVVLNIFLTRGLHFDGFGDVCDAVTTHADPEKFWTVIKDSRAGAFAILGLGMIVVGLLIFYHAMIVQGAYSTIIWSFVLGRAACVGFGYITQHLARPGLGKLYIDGATLKVAMVSGGVCFCLGLYLAGPITTVAGMILITGFLYPLHQLAEHVGGVNGDFLGCSVLLGEVAAGLAFTLFI